VGVFLKFLNFDGLFTYVILFCTLFHAQNIASRLKRRLIRKLEEVEEVEENVKAGCLLSISIKTL
jgi:hypothetical protein